MHFEEIRCGDYDVFVPLAIFCWEVIEFLSSTKIRNFLTSWLNINISSKLQFNSLEAKPVVSSSISWTTLRNYNLEFEVLTAEAQIKINFSNFTAR